MDHFSIANTDDGSDAAAALYKQEINDLKIEKLGNRLTIITIILPCLIGAILVYGYLDIKDRVSTIHDTGQNQMDSVAKDFETKLNSIEVDLAKVKFSLEKEIPELTDQVAAMGEELTRFSELAKTKAGKDETQKELEQIQKSIKTLSKRVNTIAGQHQTALNILDRTSKETLDIVNQNSKNLEKRMEAKIDSKIKTAFNENFDKKLVTHAKGLESKISALEHSVESKLASLQEAIEILAENKKNIAQLRQRYETVDTAIKTLKTDVQKTTSTLSKGSTDKKYVDSRIRSLKNSLTNRIDQLDLKLSRKILELGVMKQSRKGSSNATEKKTNPSGKNNGSFLETDLSE